MERPLASFTVPGHIEALQVAGYPMPRELADVLERHRISTFAELQSLSPRDFLQAGDKDGTLALELGCLIRETARGEHGRLENGREFLCAIAGG